MLMPIVSMNKMAMNESVAATCCYRERVSATNVYWEAISGHLASGYVEKADWKGNEDILNGKWTKWLPDYDIKGGSFAGLPNRIISDQEYDDAGKLTTLYTFLGGASPSGDGGAQFKSIKDWLDHDEIYSLGQACTHSDGNCTYFDTVAEWTPNQHWNSSAKHDTDGGNYLKPHTAKPWSS